MLLIEVGSLTVVLLSTSYGLTPMQQDPEYDNDELLDTLLMQRLDAEEGLDVDADLLCSSRMTGGSVDVARAVRLDSGY